MAKHLNTVLWGTASAMALFLPQGAMAQDKVDADDAASRERQMEIVVVTGRQTSRSATKTDTPLIETPQSISLISAENLAIRNVQGLEEALRYTPGVTVDEFGYDPRYEQSSIRGFAATFFGDFRDGLKQVSGNGAFFRTEPYGLQALEVFRGPSSVLYGQNAPGGLINAISKAPSDTPIRELQLNAGNFDRVGVQADIGDSVESLNMDWRLTGVYRDSDGQIPGSVDNRRYIAPTVRFDLSPNTELTLRANYLEDETSATPNYVTIDGEVTDVYIADFNWDSFAQEQVVFGYEFEHRFSEDWRVRQNLRYGEINLDQLYQFIAGFDAASSSVVRGRGILNEDSAGLVVDNQLLGRLSFGGVEHNLLFGIDVSDSGYEFDVALNFADNFLSVVTPDYGRTFTAPPPFAFSEQDSEQYGFYVQDQIKVGKFVGTLGLRYDDASTETVINFVGAPPNTPSEVSDSAVTYRAAGTYLSDSGLAPYISYSTSFQLTAGVDANGNAFQPSEGKQLEAGVKYEFSSFPAFATLSVFDIEQTNVRTTDPVNVGFFVQSGKVNANGVEAELAARPIEGLDLALSYAYLDTEIESNGTDDGRSRQLQPDHKVTAFANYIVQTGAFKGLEIGGGARYVGESFASVDNSVTNSEEVFADAHIGYSFDKWRIGINATNVFDNEAFNCSFGNCAPGLERTVLASLRLNW